jgi:hypothetical protein
MLPFTVLHYEGFNYYLVGALVIVEIIDPPNCITGDYHFA